MMKFNLDLQRQPANHQNFSRSYGGDTKKKKYYKIETQSEAREEVKEVVKRGKGGGWREGEVLQLYPELQGSQEFHPWKSSLSFSPSRSLENSASTRLYTAAVHTHIHFHTVVHTKTDMVFSSESFCPLFSPPQRKKPLPTPLLPYVGRSLELAGQTKSAAQGWLGSSHWRKWPRPECMAADTTRHVASDSLTLTLSLFLLAASPLLFKFLQSIILFPVNFFLPSCACSCPTQRGH